MKSDLSKYLAKLGRRGARARNAKLNAKERKKIARRAAQVRWKKRGKK